MNILIFRFITKSAARINREVNDNNIHCIYLKLLFQDEINSDTYNLVSGIYAASSNHKLHILTTQLADCQNSE